MDILTIGEQVKALRMELGMTQVQFAAAIGKSQGDLSNIENDVHEPRISALNDRLARVGRVAVISIVKLEDISY